MTEDDIIRMAREAGFAEKYGYVTDLVCIEGFANLVAAAERGECAKLCDAIHAKHIESYGDYLGDTYAVECATAIRARGNT
jgi:hypothetical protein